MAKKEVIKKEKASEAIVTLELRVILEVMSEEGGTENSP